MTPLLSLYDRVDAQAVSIQAAVLEEVTYLKVMGTGGQQVYAKAKGATKSIANWIGISNSIDDTPPMTTPEMVIKRSEGYFRLYPERARRFVLNTLAERLQAPVEDIGLLSTRLIEEAAAGYGISEGLLISQMAEQVAKRYIEDCIEGIREHLRKQTGDEMRVTEGLLAKQIAEMSLEEKLAIQKALNLQNLSGSSLRSAFVSTGLPVAGIAALQAGGFGTYLALTTVMHAVFTGILGITLPFAAYTSATSALSVLTGPAGILISLSVGVLGYFWGQRKIERSQYAMIVWTCVMQAQKPLVPPTALLPSYQGQKLLSDGATTSSVASPDGERLDHLALLQERTASAVASDELRKAQAAVDSLDARIRRSEVRLRDAEKELASSQAKAAFEVNLSESLKHIVARQQEQIANHNRELAQHRAELESAKKQADFSKKKASQAEKKYVNRLERRSAELKALWAIHYPKIDFHQQPFRWVAEQDFGGRLEAERALRELADAPDPVKLSRSKMHATGEHHSRFTIPDRVECRLFYKVKDGRVEVRRMCKKKDC